MFFLKQIIVFFVMFSFLSSCVSQEKTTSNYKVTNGFKMDLPESRAELGARLVKAYQKTPSAKTAWNIGRYYFSEKNYTKAEYWFRHSVSMIKNLDQYKGAFVFYVYLGKACMWQGKIKPAIQYFEKAVQSNPNEILKVEFNSYKEAHFHLGVLYGMEKNLAESEKNFSAYLKWGGDRFRVARERKRFRIAKQE